MSVLNLQQNLADMEFTTQSYLEQMEKMPIRPFGDLSTGEKVIAALAFTPSPMTIYDIEDMIGLKIDGKAEGHIELFMEFLSDIYYLKITTLNEKIREKNTQIIAENVIRVGNNEQEVPLIPERKTELGLKVKGELHTNTYCIMDSDARAELISMLHIDNNSLEEAIVDNLAQAYTENSGRRNSVYENMVNDALKLELREKESRKARLLPPYNPFGTPEERKKQLEA